MTQWVNNYLALVFFGAAIFIALSLKMANAWEKSVILRMGKLQSVKGPGLFVIIPANVDAIIFWHVHDAEKAALAITNYREAIDRVAQTSLVLDDDAEQAGCGCSRCRNAHRHVPDVRGPAGSRAHAMLGGTVDLRPCGSLVPGRERSREGRAHQMAPPYCSGPMKY